MQYIDTISKTWNEINLILKKKLLFSCTKYHIINWNILLISSQQLAKKKLKEYWKLWIIAKNYIKIIFVFWLHTEEEKQTKLLNPNAWEIWKDLIKSDLKLYVARANKFGSVKKKRRDFKKNRTKLLCFACKQAIQLFWELCHRSKILFPLCFSKPFPLENEKYIKFSESFKQSPCDQFYVINCKAFLYN